MKKKIKKILVLIVGIVFIIFGLLGLVLPFLQGIIFLVIGFFLVSFYFPGVRTWLNKHREKYPQIFTIIDKVEKWMIKVVGEI